MKRYIKFAETYPELRGEFPIKISYHSTSNNNSDIQIKLSYKTALLFINGQNVCSFYPTPKDSPNFWVREIKEACQDYGYNVSDDKAYDLATYMVENIRG